MFENHCSSAHVVLPHDHLDRGVETSSCHKMCPHVLYFIFMWRCIETNLFLITKQMQQLFKFILL